ncbi:hypothetical protein WJX81_007695 [Elliptochloris bilobata]|uniref:Rhodanese domain-containing protein n=1 Tax=Elliptochloris bilobata TaxID=381761 RepID=A0AAW1QZ72_9CHLO
MAAALSVTLLSVPAALALDTVELQPAQPPPITTNFDVVVPSDVSQLLKDYPTLPFAGAFLVGAPLVFAAASQGGGKVKAATPGGAYDALASEDKAVLVDIRSIAQRASGSPDLKGLKKKSVLQLPFTKTVKGEVVPVEDFVARAAKLSGVSEETTVVLLDADGKDAPQAAKLLAPAVGKVLYTQAEGPRGWKEAGAPWKEPAKLPSLNLKGLGGLGRSMDAFAEDFKVKPTAGKAALGLGAVALGAGAAALLLFQEVETVLQVVGVVVAGRFAASRLVFAEDRKRTAEEFKTLVDEKIAVKDAGEDLKQIAATLLETEQSVESLLGARAEAAAADVRDKAKDLVGEVKSQAREASAAVRGEAQSAQASTSSDAKQASDAPNGSARQWINNWQQGQAN